MILLRVNGFSRGVCYRAVVASQPFLVPCLRFSLAWRFYATEADQSNQIAPYLKTLKEKLKETMRAKDGPRLAILRSIISANLNASKTKKPIRTDQDLMQMIWGMKQSLTEAIKESITAQRQDLVEKQKLEMSIIDEYIKTGPLKPVSDEEVVIEVKRVIDDLVSKGVDKKRIMPETMKAMNTTYKDSLFDRKTLVKVVGEEVGKL